MTTTADPRVPVVDLGYLRQRARRLVDAGVARVEVLRARPVWDGPQDWEEQGRTVRVRACVSPLAVLEAYERLGDDEYLLVLTDRSDQELGDTVLLRAAGRRTHVVDPWSAVPDLFGARQVDRAVYQLGPWLAEALFAYAPPSGWPRTTGPTLTLPHALTHLLQAVLALRPGSPLDEVSLLGLLDVHEHRTAWQQAPADLKAKIISALPQVPGLDRAAPLALRAVAPPTERRFALAIGLALDALWPDDPHAGSQDPERPAARVRAQHFLGGREADDESARAYAAVARVVHRRLPVHGPESTRALEVAQQLLEEECLWPAGAERSDLLRAGLRHRLRALGAQVDLVLDGSETRGGVEGALQHLKAHRLAAGDAEVACAEMAVRLLRWLETATTSHVKTLSTAVREQVADGGWVDRALTAVWVGSTDQQVGAVYQRLMAEVREGRRARDRAAAAVLAKATATSQPLHGAWYVEDLRSDVVERLHAAGARPLLLVLDGMSAAVASEVAESVAGLGLGWTELFAPAPGGLPVQRGAAVAALPTMTTFSRTSLLCGRPVAGVQTDEASAWRRDLGGAIFHKGDLVREGGDQLPAAFREALERDAPVAVVLNAVDDALSKADPATTSWTVDAVQHLRAIVEAAADARRTLVLTSDHGHVLERNSEGRSVAGADARWRPADAAPLVEGEVLVEGPRVLTDGRAVLSWDERLRYGKRTSGYHGGASLAELTIPVLVMARGASPEVAGWRPGPPQTPTWWLDPLPSREVPSLEPVREQWQIGGAVVDLARAERPRRRGKAPDVSADQGDLGFEITVPVPVPAAASTTTEAAAPRTIVDAALASPVMAAQRQRAGRRALGEAELRDLLDALLTRGGRAHRDTLAAVLGLTTGELPGRLVAARRLLNVDGYEVLGEDLDGVTVVLDATALREQLEIGGA
ncbi:BREX-2 system phosphatase PglZ [Cellulomonas endophytica]|uniref:BREX-2 system phosphatase PglZ n=1 Tax=Cellulomonas endophytica TaxID=2494735 RepID=UPI0013E90496|nr:BREX-2 system phosphatase PglZ [Cellulomonas endophytica]